MVSNRQEFTHIYDVAGAVAGKLAGKVAVAGISTREPKHAIGKRMTIRTTFLITKMRESHFRKMTNPKISADRFDNHVFGKPTARGSTFLLTKT